MWVSDKKTPRAGLTLDAYQELEVTILVFHHCGTRVSVRPGDDEGAQLMEIRRSHRFRERQLACKYRRYPDLVGFNVDIW